MAPSAPLVGPDRPPRLLLTAQTTGAEALRYLTAPGAAPTLLLSRPIKSGSFDLALDDYRATALHRFFYQLRLADAPADSVAGVQTTGRHLRLRGLDAGTYELALMGPNAGRRMASRLVRVVVDRPWWQHPLALLAVAGRLLGAGVGVQQLRIRRLQREA